MPDRLRETWRANLPNEATPRCHREIGRWSRLNGRHVPLTVPLAGRAEWGTTALRAAHCIPQVGHSWGQDGVDDLQVDLPELDAVE
jgi:hypothetical protein